MEDEMALTPSSVIADIGSGTGILSRLFLGYGNLVYAVEPNPEMRSAAEASLSRFPNFRSVAGSAETTTLNEDLVDFVIAGQSFHWFELELARREFRRILRPGGGVMLVWNVRDSGASSLMRSYEEVLRNFAIDYRQVAHSRIGDREFDLFFESYAKQTFKNRQVLDFDGLAGRVLSSSYAPTPRHEKFDPMMAALSQLFRAHERDGDVILFYNTEVFFGRIR
jgi:SAM-dependent methyltransferase